MSMSIPQRFITNLETFTWGKDWRAKRIMKEKRTNGEYYFATIVRYYGETEDTHDYDISPSYADRAILGRVEKFVGKRQHDIDPDSPTFGKRIYTKAITETITEEDSNGKPREREILIEGKSIYEYTLPVNEENTKKLKTLQGSISLNQDTKLMYVYGATPPLVVPPETFWKTSVTDYLQQIDPLVNKKNDKKA